MAKDIKTIIEITDAHVKVVQSKPQRGTAVISACEVRALQNFTDEELVRLLNEMTASRSIPIADLVIVIPRRFVILKQMQLPSVNEQEIQKMISLQLVNQIPYPLDDIVYNEIFVERDASGYTHVLVIVIHKEIIDRFLKVFQKIGLRPKQLTLSSLGLVEWLKYQEQKKKLDLSQPVALIHIDSVQTEICFCRQDKLIFSRQLNYGAKDLNTDNMVAFTHQIDLSLSSYRKENMGPAVSKIIMVCSLPEVNTIAEKIQKELTLPVQVMTSFDNILSQKNISLTSFKNQLGVSFGVPFGLAQMEKEKILNFLPKEIDDTEKNKVKKLQWVKFIFLLLAILVLTASFFGVEVYQKTMILKNIEQRNQQLKPEMAKADKVIKFVQFFEDDFKGRVLIADLMDELYNLIPTDISLRTFEFDEKGALSIQGYAENGASVNVFQSSLVKSSFFKEVNLEFATKRRIFNLELTDFKIVCQLNNNAGQK